MLDLDSGMYWKLSRDTEALGDAHTRNATPFMEDTTRVDSSRFSRPLALTSALLSESQGGDISVNSWDFFFLST